MDEVCFGCRILKTGLGLSTQARGYRRMLTKKAKPNWPRRDMSSLPRRGGRMETSAASRRPLPDPRLSRDVGAYPKAGSGVILHADRCRVALLLRRIRC